MRACGEGVGVNEKSFAGHPPFEVNEPARQTLPFVFNSPHSGRVYPGDFLDASRLDPHTIRISEDYYVDELFGSVPYLGAPLLAAHFPRAYLDVNREPYELDPSMLDGPVPATQKALKKAGLSVDDIDLFELNEAFASVVLRYQNRLGIPDEKINVNGGAIAMGHPIGATGAMILGTLLDELERRDLKRGLVTLCAGGGIGIATIIERV